MKMGKMKEGNNYILSEVSFLDLKIIKEACKAYAKQGSAPAEKIAKEIDELMNNMTV